MKKMLALTLATIVSAPLMAQEGSGSGDKHMFTFDADSVLQGVYSIDKSKVRGSEADNDSQLKLNLNYFWALPNMQKIQVGGGLNYLKDTGSAGDVENWGFRIGGIYNLTDDLKSAVYGKLLLGMDWNREYGSRARGGNFDDEVLNATFAVGKRFDLTRWGLNHLVYTPEIALVKEDSTTGGDFEYAQSLELRFLQFAVFF